MTSTTVTPTSRRAGSSRHRRGGTCRARPRAPPAPSPRSSRRPPPTTACGRRPPGRPRRSAGAESRRGNAPPRTEGSRLRRVAGAADGPWSQPIAPAAIAGHAACGRACKPWARAPARRTWRDICCTDPEEDSMKVKDIMTVEPACCAPDTNLGEVARLMVEHDCGEIPVVQSNGVMKPVGVITDRDIVCRTVAQQLNPLEMTAADCMTEGCITVAEDAGIDACCALLEQHQV